MTNELLVISFILTVRVFQVIHYEILYAKYRKADKRCEKLL